MLIIISQAVQALTTFQIIRRLAILGIITYPRIVFSEGDSVAQTT